METKVCTDEEQKIISRLDGVLTQLGHAWTVCATHNQDEFYRVARGIVGLCIGPGAVHCVESLKTDELAAGRYAGEFSLRYLPKKEGLGERVS